MKVNLSQLNAQQRRVVMWRPPSWAERARGIHVRVIAHAGSGKTLTLRALTVGLLQDATRRSDEQAWLRLTYLCFNKSAADEAQTKFPSRSERAGLDVRTLHSSLLAYVRTTCETRFACPTRLNLSCDQLADVVDRRTNGALTAAAQQRMALGCSSARKGRTGELAQERRDLARLAWRAVEVFCRSAERELSVNMVPWSSRRDEVEARRFGGTGAPRAKVVVVPFAKALWAAASNLDDDTVACTQQVISKVALERLVANPNHKLGWAYFDGTYLTPHAIFVDEAQDLDDCALAVLELQRQRGPTNIWHVGDPAQAIYHFRGASDKALRDSTLSGCARDQFRLSRSYRFGPNLAQYANLTLYMKRYYDRSFNYEPIVGSAPLDTRVHNWMRDEALPTPPLTVICRSNKGILHAASIFLRAESHCHSVHDRPHSQTRVGTELAMNLGDGSLDSDSAVNTLLNMLDEVYAFFAEGRSTVRLAGWPTFAQLARAVEVDDNPSNKDEHEDEEEPQECIDPVLKEAVRSVLAWRSELPRLTARIRAAIKLAETAPADSVVRFATVHQSKGLEWDRVFVYNDFADFVTREGRVVAFIRQEEINLWHVAVTRARTDLWLPPKFQKLLEYHVNALTRVPGGPTTPKENTAGRPSAGRVGAGPSPLLDTTNTAFCTSKQLFERQQSDAPSARKSKGPAPISLRATLGTLVKPSVRAAQSLPATWSADTCTQSNCIT